jgi:hypothetical protein
MKSVIVLAVPHQLQGPNFHGYVKDPSYEKLVRDFIGGGVDFVFEEAAGQGPSSAEEIANSVLGPRHYLNIDPPVNERENFGIPAETGFWEPIDRVNAPRDVYENRDLEAHAKREKVWVEKILAQHFVKGLAICGLAHGLSVALRLLFAGVGDKRTYSYAPYHKLGPSR